MDHADFDSHAILSQAHERAQRLLGELIRRREELDPGSPYVLPATGLLAEGQAALSGAAEATRRLVQDLHSASHASHASHTDASARQSFDASSPGDSQDSQPSH